MPAILDATVGGSASNSYASLLEAQAYVDGVLYADAWTEADADTQTRALITATRFLDESVTWLGWPASTTQALAWPRSGVRTRNGGTIGIGVLPRALVSATVELARQLITAGALPDAPSDLPVGIKRAKLGGMEVEFFDGAAASGRVEWLPMGVWQLIGFLVASRSGMTCVPLERV